MSSPPPTDANADAVYHDGELPADADLVAPDPRDGEIPSRRNDSTTHDTTAEEE